MNKPRILITGAEGQLGQCFQKVADTLDADFVFASRNALDITDQNAINVFFDGWKFDFCINTAAYTKVDLAEQEKKEAHLINSSGPGMLAETCAKHACTFFHISSDYVYHNGLTRPLREDDPTSPASVYARSKLEGELNALKSNPRSIILRSSWIFSEFGHNFVMTMARLMTAGKALRVVNDQIGCPTYAGDLATAILQIIKVIQSDQQSARYGTYNYCNEGAVTWYDFALEIATQLDLTVELTPVSSIDYSAAASRPSYSVLDTSKIKEAYQITPSHWRERLTEVLERM